MTNNTLVTELQCSDLKPMVSPALRACINRYQQLLNALEGGMLNMALAKVASPHVVAYQHIIGEVELLLVQSSMGELKEQNREHRLGVLAQMIETAGEDALSINSMLPERENDEDFALLRAGVAHFISEAAEHLNEAMFELQERLEKSLRA
jgi:hypothetical protein